MYIDELDEIWRDTADVAAVGSKVAEFLRDGSSEGPHVWRDVLESEVLPPSCLDFVDVDFTLRDPDGHDAYYAALLRSSDVAVTWLFSKGVRVSRTPMYDGRTSLHFAAEHNRCAAIVMLLKRGARAHINSADIAGQTPLADAVGSGSFAAAATLLCLGANPNVVADKVGYSPLRTAVRKDSSDLVSLLLSFGANPDLPSWGGLSASDDARHSDRPNANYIRGLLASHIQSTKNANG